MPPLLAGLFHGLVDDPAFLPHPQRDLREGQHRNPTPNLMYFTTAYFHLPAELWEEARAASLVVDVVLAVEGPAWMTGPGMRAGPTRSGGGSHGSAPRVEADPAVLGMSAHLLLVAHKA